MSAAKCLFFQGFEGHTKLFDPGHPPNHPWMSAGCLVRKNPAFKPRALVKNGRLLQRENGFTKRSYPYFREFSFQGMVLAKRLAARRGNFGFKGKSS